MEASSRASSVESEGNQRIKCGNEDLISALPDCLIHHILSFLPSTRDAIRTGILSKRWLRQWTHVPILIFKPEPGMSSENFCHFIDKALSVYNCSKIKKFVIDSSRISLDDLGSKLDTWILFAAARHARELTLDHAYDFFEHCKNYHVPLFLFRNASLVKFRAHCCAFMPEGNVNWESLKALYIGYSSLPNQVIENVLSGCPVIEFLELGTCDGFDELAIVSQSLKTFRLMEFGLCTAIEISCPNLGKLELLGRISCTNLKLNNLPPSVCAILDFGIQLQNDYEGEESFKLVKEILRQVQHVRELKIGSCISMILVCGVLRGESSLLLNNKCLTMMDPFARLSEPGFPFVLLSFPFLEKLAIQLPEDCSFVLEEHSVEARARFWEKDESAFGRLMSHLKTVAIECLSYSGSNKNFPNLLNFLKFILKNARVLEKIILLEPERKMDFALEVCQNFSGVRKSSQHAVVEVACLARAYKDRDWDKIVC